MNRARLEAWKFPEVDSRFTDRDTILYAMGVQACRDPMDAGQLRLVYEKQLQALPSMACVLAHPGFWVKAPELEIDYVKLVHAEQHIQLDQPLPAQGQVRGSYKISAVLDKGPDKGALLYFEKRLKNAWGEVIGTVRSTYFLRGDGGCGTWGERPSELREVPSTIPGGSIDVPTDPTTALLYRLSGDRNPLHADPEFARAAGFDRPILHGLCTYGIACHSLVTAACGGDPSRLRAMGARFTKPVYPGETIRTEYWSGDNGSIQFRCVSRERDVIVLDRGEATIV